VTPRGGAASFRKAVVSAVVACLTAAHVFSAASYASPRSSNLYVSSRLNLTVFMLFMIHEAASSSVKNLIPPHSAAAWFTSSGTPWRRLPQAQTGSSADSSARPSPPPPLKPSPQTDTPQQPFFFCYARLLGLLARTPRGTRPALNICPFELPF